MGSPTSKSDIGLYRASFCPFYHILPIFFSTSLQLFPYRNYLFSLFSAIHMSIKYISKGRKEGRSFFVHIMVESLIMVWLKEKAGEN